MRGFAEFVDEFSPILKAAVLVFLQSAVHHRNQSVGQLATMAAYRLSWKIEHRDTCLKLVIGGKTVLAGK